MCPLEFVCQREELLRGISIVERAATSKESMQILEGIYIRAEGDHLHLAATDLELSIECDVPATVVQQGEAVLGSKVLSPIVRKLVGDQLVYRTSESGVAQIESGPSHFTVHTMVADEFPALPEVESTGLWRISQGELRRLIRHTAFAAATDDSRPFLTGVFVEVEQDEIRLVATDSSRLAFRRGKLLEETDRPRSGIVPVRALSELMRILDDDDDAVVEFEITESQAVFRAAGVQMISRVIEGQFPDYRRVLATDQPTRFRLDRTQLLAAVERVALIARRSTPVVRLAVKGETLSLSSREAEVGQAYEELTVVKEGEDLETAYQARFLTEVLRAMDSDQVEVGLGDGLRQGSITPVGDENYVYIVMPVRVG